MLLSAKRATFAPSKHIYMYTDSDIFDRARLLLGDAAMGRMASARVILFGVGGVGSWCAECLVRTGATADSFHLDGYDCIVDAIDSLRDKVLLIETACRTDAAFFSSMGAALKIDPTKIRVAEFWKVEGCPLARALRMRFKRLGRRPARKFLCVYSAEPPLSMPAAAAREVETTGQSMPNGSLMHITASFGLALAGLVVQTIRNVEW